MRQRSVILIASLAIGLSSVSSHGQGKVEVYGGYSYLRPAFSQTETFICVQSPCPLNEVVFPPLVVTTHPNLNGWNVSGAFMVAQWLSTKAEFSGNYGTALGSSTARIHTFLFGPEARWPGHISPFVQALFGGAHLSSSGGTIANYAQYNTVLSKTDSAFALALGGGIDAKVRSLVWVRLIQLDDLVTRFQSGMQNQPRISAGVVIRF